MFAEEHELLKGSIFVLECKPPKHRPFHHPMYWSFARTEVGGEEARHLRILNPGEMAAETRSSQAPTPDRSPLLFGGTCRAPWLYIRHIPPLHQRC